MLICLIFGIARFPVWTPLAVSVFGLVLDAMLFSSASLRREALGLGQADSEAVVLIASIGFAIALNYAAYLIGRGTRNAWDRLRSRHAPAVHVSGMDRPVKPDDEEGG